MNQLTREEFQNALKKGLGRAVAYVRNSPAEIVRKDLVYASTHFIGRNLQDEGSRVPWLFSMIEVTGELDFYRQKVVDAIEQMSDDPDDAQTFDELFGFLAEFAARGDDEVLEIMRQRFDSACVLHQPSFGFDDLFRIDGFDALLRLLRREWKRICNDEELWADNYEINYAKEQLGEEVVQSALEEAARNDESVRLYLDRMQRQQDALKAERAARKDMEKEPTELSSLRDMIDDMENDWPTETEWTHESFRAAFWPRYNRFRQVGRLYAKPTPEELEYAFQRLLETNDPGRQYCLLGIFDKVSMPRFTPRLFSLLFDAPNSYIRSAANLALSRLTDPTVRDIGLQLIAKGPETWQWYHGLKLLEENFMTDPAVREKGMEIITKETDFQDWHYGICLLEKNLQPGDELIIQKKLESTPPNIDIHDHTVAFAILDLAEAHPEVSFETLLLWVYENTYCPNCRFRSVEIMTQRNIAPQYLLDECLDDSYQYTRELIQELPPPTPKT